MKRIPIEELKTKKYSLLSIIWDAYVKKKRRFVNCKCDCWNTKILNLGDIRWWKILSCWCYNKKSAKKRATTHWMSHTTWLYTVWKWIKSRCNNKNGQHYNCYWGRWIKCEWKSFEEFYKDMKDGYKKWLTIDRIDNGWNYIKENCRWATAQEQTNNRRSNHIIIWEWKEYTMRILCDTLWISYRKLRYRINTLSWNSDRAINLLLNNI
jgi:hypothetical protein